MSDMVTLPILKNPMIDLTVDLTEILLCGALEDGTFVRIPMKVETAMRVLALLQTVQQDNEFPTPDMPTLIDKIQ